MLLKISDLEKISRGEIDLVFRRWKRPTVKAGGTLKTRLGVLQIGRVDELRPEQVTAEDARRAGFAGLEDFHRWLATMKQGPLFQRIEVSYRSQPDAREQ
jgi:hypothetical protein